MEPDHTIVLTSYKRPNNLPRVLNAVLNQTVPHTRLVLVDNSPRQFHPSVKDTRAFDDVIRFEDNAGPCCRYFGAMFADTKYTLFLDDDMLVGNRFVEACYEAAKTVDDKFATISGIGRSTHRNKAYRKDRTQQRIKMLKRNVKRLEKQRGIDVTCRGHFFHSTSIGYAVKYYQMAKEQGLGKSVLRNDDMFLSLGSQLDTGFKSYMTGRLDNAAETSMNRKELASPFACSGNDDHRISRNAVVKFFLEQGWRPLRYKE
jgi:glycosyltransferase involved in cell wall biosynthesis